MKNIALLLLFHFCLSAGPAYAHEGHDSPGALPPPPNGGKMAEASHAGAHAGGAEERELFIEAKLQGSKVLLFAQGLSATNTKVWQALSPGPELKVIEAKIELPRAKRSLPVTLKVNGKGWEGDLSSVKEHRLIVVVDILDGKEKKTAKVQLEK